MTDQTIKLDAHRGMAAQEATELRLLLLLLSDAETNEKLSHQRPSALEDELLAAPALTWEEAADKARYLIARFARSSSAQDRRRPMLIASPRADPPSPSTERNIPCKFSFATTISIRRSASLRRKCSARASSVR